MHNNNIQTSHPRLHHTSCSTLQPTQQTVLPLSFASPFPSTPYSTQAATATKSSSLHSARGISPLGSGPISHTTLTQQSVKPIANHTIACSPSVPYSHVASSSIIFATSFLAATQSGLLTLLSQVSTWTLIATLPVTIAHLAHTVGPIAQYILRHIILLLIFPTATALILFPQSVATWFKIRPLRLTPARQVHPTWLFLLLITLWSWMDCRLITIPTTLYLVYIVWLLPLLPTRHAHNWSITMFPTDVLGIITNLGRSLHTPITTSTSPGSNC